MNNIILELRKLNGAYIASLEYDRCPGDEKTMDVIELFETGLSEEELRDSLSENEGRRPDEIASEMSDLIIKLS